MLQDQVWQVHPTKKWSLSFGVTTLLPLQPQPFLPLLAVLKIFLESVSDIINIIIFLLLQPKLKVLKVQIDCGDRIAH